MAISDTQKVDYLFKKLGYGVTKTDTLAFKRAFNESIASPLLIRGDRIWQDSGDIPAVKPSASSSQVEIYDDTGNGTATVECTEDITSSDNRTWLTGLTDWIPTEFGATYLVKIYIDTAGSTTPQSTGTQLLAAGSGNDDEWFFDYQSGVVHFIGDNLPSELATGVVFVVGARYIGTFGVIGDLLDDTNPVLGGDLDINGFKIYTSSGNSNIVLDPDGTGSISVESAPIINVADPTNAQDAATKNYVDTALAGFNQDRIIDGTTTVIADDTAQDVEITINGTGKALFDSDGLAVDLWKPYSATTVLEIDSTGSLVLPIGTSSQRPVNSLGQIRFNSEISLVEFNDGSAWSPVGQTTLYQQDFVGDGNTTTFNLSNDATVDSVLITWNGVVQHTTSYSILNQQITFSEAPLATDEVDIRYLASQVVRENMYRNDLLSPPTTSTGGNLTGQYWADSDGTFYAYNGTSWNKLSTVSPLAGVSVGASATTIISFDMTKHRSAKVVVQATNGTDYQVDEMLIIHNGTTAYRNQYSQIVTNAQFITYTVTVNSGNMLFQGTSSSGTSVVKYTVSFIDV
jgi:hypothetical protein